MLLDIVRATIERHRMIERGDCVIVAVSGGADSIVLLRVLHDLAVELGCELVAAHLDHGLRGTSGDDARFVAEQAAALGVPCVAERADVRSLAAERGRGIEEAGREARSEFLRRVADARGAARIALGHTADDQAETVLYRLARGAGARGMRAMEPAAGRLIRPLLFVGRAEVRRFAAERGLAWREDETNADVRFARNRIRANVLPELELAHPGATRAVARAADAWRDAAELEEYVVDALWGAVCEREAPGRVSVRRAALAALPAAAQGVLVREAMRRARGDLRGLGRAHVQAARRLAVEASERGRISLPRLAVAATPESIDFAALETGAPRPWSAELPLGTAVVSETGLEIVACVRPRSEEDGADAPGSWSEVADADHVALPLVARGPTRADQFRPLGMARDVRLHSFLAKAGVPASRRDRLALVCDREKIVWVVGVRLSDAVKMSETTQRVLVLQAREVEG